HGARFAPAAVAAGAAAVLTDPAGAELLAGADLGVPVLVAADVPALLGRLAAELYGLPGQTLGTFAVTGTNGKTTVAFMVDHALRALGRTTGLIGTVEVRVGDRAVPATLTTPQPADLQALLAAMVDAGVDDLVMEVSSHALALGRVEPLVYDVAGFTNLTQDHLDFHGDLESYFQAKAGLFAPARSRRGVALVDDAWGRRLVEQARAAGTPTVALAVTAAADVPADWRVEDVRVDATGTAFTLAHTDGRTLRATTAMPGTFNLANAALAAAMVLESGVDPAALQRALDATGGLSPAVPGRMEQLSDAPRVLVDFAHNTDALAQALAALRPTTTGRLVVLFGAAGERDRTKRPEMGRVAAEAADVVVVTDDDPHDEPPAQIRAEVLAGARAVRGATVREIALRAEAIRTVVLEARAEDTVLVAGRGHETVQEIAGTAHQLDDRDEVRAALAQRTGGPE
ncbi:UDP-N-acetylmuramoyl-L-alanyl-D-glutamate--2,6-diaminopimelate ligase, partial [Georgenia yuyongxinii]